MGCCPVTATNDEIVEMLHKIDKQTSQNTLQLQLVLKSQSEFVSQAEFEPIKRLAYGMVGTILLAVIGALVALVVA